MKKSINLVLIGTALSLSTVLLTTAYAEGDAKKGKAKSATCAACHGADGNGVGNPAWPKLAGQSFGYIKKQLLDFKAKEATRKDPVMTAQATPLTEDDVNNLAAYFSSQKSKPNKGDESKFELGKQVYRGGNLTNKVAACTACHGPSGEGIPSSGFPKISGQNAAYIKKQLQDFKKGVRSNDYNHMMRDITAKMTEQEIDAVAEYTSALSK